MTNYLKINRMMCLIFLFIVLLFNPIYKYAQNVLFFPRINMSILYIAILLVLILYNTYYLDKNFKEGSLGSFGLLLMISIIQLISYPWVINYIHDGSYVYLTIISKTMIQAWLFWFTGLHIVEVFNSENFWKYMSYLWIIFVFIIINNAFTNHSFLIILNGNPIYLMLADSFAMLSIFILCKNKNYKVQFIIIILSIICLLALWSRAALFCYMLTTLLFIYRSSNRWIFLFSILIFISIYINIDSSIVVDERMTRLLSGTYDTSQQMRGEQLEKGIRDLQDVWLLGSFMGDIERNFGSKGNYMHNYLSFWRQFGIIPFILFISIILSCFYKSLKYWLLESNPKPIPLFLFYFTIFCLSEIILARSFVFPYIWLSISGISSYFNDEKIKESSNKYE